MIVLQGVSKKFNQEHGLETTDLKIEDGRTTALIGPSGCGKSTLLRLIVGLDLPSTGQIYFDDEVASPSTINLIRHKIGYVIQDGGLFPHLTVHDNLSLLANYLKQPLEITKERIIYLCDLIQFPVDLLNSYPLQLSGGERQRVSLIRALMMDPGYIILDEPFASLDPLTRYELQHQLKAVFSKLKKTVILVTHDMREAAYLGDDIILMRAGKIIQRGSFQDLIHNPAEEFVTTFIQAQKYAIEISA